MEGIYDYVDSQLSQGAQLGWIARHIICLYQGMPGARRFRRHISENAFKQGAGVDVLRDAVSLVKEPTAQKTMAENLASQESKTDAA